MAGNGGFCRIWLTNNPTDGSGNAAIMTYTASVFNEGDGKHGNRHIWGLLFSRMGYQPSGNPFAAHVLRSKARDGSGTYPGHQGLIITQE